MAKNCMNITKSTFWGQKCGGTWGEWGGERGGGGRGGAELNKAYFWQEEGGQGT